MAFNWLALVAAVISFAALLLTAVSIGTTSWTTLSYFTQSRNYGLFRLCYNDGTGEQCGSAMSSDTSFVVCGSRTAGDWNNYFRAMDGFAISTIVIAGIVLVVALLQGTGKWRGNSPLQGMICCVFGFASGILLIILWAAFAGSYAFCGTSICAHTCHGLSGCSCGVGFSFYLLCVVVGLFLTVGVLEYFLHRQFSAASSNYAPVTEQQQMVATAI